MMKKVEIVIIIVTLYAILFQLTPVIGFPDQVISPMFFLSPFLVIYMVYVILKHGKQSQYTFDEKFYDDWDYDRLPEEK